MVALVVAADDAHRALERLAVQPQFAVQGHAGQSGREPRGGMVDIALPREEPAAVPPGPHAVELFRHPPAGQIGAVVPRMGQEQIGHGGVPFVVLAGLGGRQGAEPLPLHLFAAPTLSGACRCGARLAATGCARPGKSRNRPRPRFSGCTACGPTLAPGPIRRL